VVEPGDADGCGGQLGFVDCASTGVVANIRAARAAGSIRVFMVVSYLFLVMS
jgi:hypothetical protein